MKTIMMTLTAALCAVTAVATPSSNSVEAVKQEWYNGNYSNVYELAQQRLAVNSNDVVAAHLMMEYDTAFSSRTAMSNSVMRLVEVSDTVTLPAFVEHYQAMRSGWIWYASEYLPSRTDAQLEAHRQKAHETHRAMSSDFLLEILDEGGLW